MSRFSICIITKDEGEKLEHCLRAVRHFFSEDDAEIVIVDTGSSDDSVSIAKRYTSSVYMFPWRNDFAAAKNFSIDKATNDTVLVLDTDEYIDAVDDSTLSQMISPSDQIGLICRKNHFYSGDELHTSIEYIPRLFSKSYYHYEGRIHEQLAPIDFTLAQGIPVRKNTSIVIDHDGYLLDEASIQKKADRNIALLQAELDLCKTENTEDNRIAYLLYQLGKSYYFKKDYAAAADYFSDGLSYDLDEHLEYVIDMVVSYGYALINSNQIEKALDLSGVYETFSEDADYLFVMGLIFMKNALFDEAVDTFLSATKCKTARIEGANSYLAYYNIGVIYECLGYLSDAKSYYKKCGDYPPAIRNQTNI